MNLDNESIQRHLPHYLTTEERGALHGALKDISEGRSAEYLLSDYHDSFKGQMLQGDGWRGFELFEFKTGTRHLVPGIVLSNTCDVDPNNPRDIPSKIIFSPLVPLTVYETKLRDAGVDDKRLANKMTSIKEQKITDTFYLPASGNLAEDHVIRFDDIHSMPMDVHSESQSSKKLFTLSNLGFYMLVLKLSIHFCRLQENINRDADMSAS